MENYSILCVDNDRNTLNALSVILKKSGYNVYSALSGYDALKVLEEERVDIAIVDYKMPSMSGIELLKKMKDLQYDVDVLILTGHGTIPSAVESVKLGAFDYILKPFHKDDLLNRIDKILQIKKLQYENVLLKERLKGKYQFKNLIGKTPKMVEMFELISKISNSDSIVLILGETGTGKEEIAKAIHYSGNRSQRIFNVVDCASINPNLFESELFGHVKGAFTGAINDKIGLLKATGDGTLLFDEIAEIPIYIQIKLLRAIEERVVRAVGSIQPQKFDARIIAATSRNLQEAIKKQEFREDLFFRLNVVSIEIPPLRERKDDIPLLINHFIQKFDKNRNLIERISDSALQILLDYNWPGNVRELENYIERAFTLGVKGLIETKDLPKSILSTNKEIIDSQITSESTLSEYEKEIIIKTLKETEGNKRKTAGKLNIGVTTLYRKLKKYNIE